jgi:hypothetical protein
MQESAVRYARWKAPAEDGQVLLWPDPADLLRDTQTNHTSLADADAARIQNLPLAHVRSAMRKWLGHVEDQFLIATGHQAELHHPGVWAKNALIDAVAAKSGGRAFHFAVDTDEPKHLSLRWPGGAAPLTDDASTERAQWSGLVAPPSPAHLARIDAQFAQISGNWNFHPLVPEFLGTLRRLALSSANLPSALTESLHQLDWELGLRYDAMIVSPICLSEPYLVFVHHLLARAEQFGADYNATLERYRLENKIRAPGRPMPNLKISADSCEVPFWLDSLAAGTRSRATVARSGDVWALRSSNGDEFHFDPAADGWEAAGRLLLWLRSQGLRLSPRALTLTAILRLLVADQFVHGIGGGQYDQVLDALIATHFGIDPPRFSVTTATLFFPGAVGQPRVCLPCLLQDGHRLKHRALGPEKMRMVEQIHRLPRRSPERSQLFFQMHDRLTAAWGFPPVKTWEQEFRQAEARAQEERVLFDRELFYAIQPPDRLKDLIDRFRTRVGTGRGLG